MLLLSSVIDKHYEGAEQSDLNLIESAGYGYEGIGGRIQGNRQDNLETELGYYFNKTQVNLDRL